MRTTEASSNIWNPHLSLTTSNLNSVSDCKEKMAPFTKELHVDLAKDEKLKQQKLEKLWIQRLQHISGVSQKISNNAYELSPCLVPNHMHQPSEH